MTSLEAVCLACLFVSVLVSVGEGVADMFLEYGVLLFDFESRLLPVRCFGSSSCVHLPVCRYLYHSNGDAQQRGSQQHSGFDLQTQHLGSPS